jgi:hypothetical protein
VAAFIAIEDPNLSRKLWGRYLRYEERYDAWSGLGKLLVLAEILTGEGFDVQQLAREGVEFQKLVNLVFPRTFFSLHNAPFPPDLSHSVYEYYTDEKYALSLQEIEETEIESLALEETASKFDRSVEEVAEVIRELHG